MALIKCLECQQEISDKANNCPHCGYPLNENELTKIIDGNINTVRLEKNIQN